MKKNLFLLLLMTTLLNRNVFAQDIDLIKHVVEDGSLSLMVPAGWRVDEDLEVFPALMVTNDPDWLSMNDFQENLGQGEYMLLILVIDRDSVGLLFPDVDTEAPFEGISTELIRALEELSDAELEMVIHNISFESIHSGQNIALAEATVGGLDSFISVHQVDDALVFTVNLVAPGDRDALRERVLQIVPTLEFASGEETAQNNFTVVGDPSIDVNIQDAMWMSDFAPVNLSRQAVQSFKFEIRDPGDSGAIVQVIGLPLDIEPGVYTVDPLGAIEAQITVVAGAHGNEAVALVGTLTVDESSASISGSFDLQTASEEVEPTTVTGNFTDVTIPDVSNCIITASGATLHIEGDSLPEVDTEDAVWIIEPGLNLYISDGERVVALKGIRRDANSDNGDIVSGLFEITTATDGSRSVDVQVLSGTVLISSGNELSGEFDLMVNGDPDTRISGDFSDIPIPAQSCAQASD
jgi:hypothetical protein